MSKLRLSEAAVPSPHSRGNLTNSPEGKHESKDGLGVSTPDASHPSHKFDYVVIDAPPDGPGTPAKKRLVTNPVLQAVLSKQVVAVISSVLWMSVSSGLILVNKYIMSNDGFHYPMALSGLGMSFSAVASYFCCKVIRVVECKRVMTPRFYITRIMPIGLFMALTLHFGNTVYLYLTVSFIQMLKAFTPIVTMVALFIAQLETPTTKLISAIVLIAIGTAMASYGEVNMSVIGLTIMFASETFEAIRLVMTQVLLVGLKYHPIEGLMYLAPACTFWLLLGVASMEWPTMVKEGALLLMYNNPWLYACAAVMGFGVNSLAYVVIQTASSLTLKVLGTVKNALVVWVGIIFLREVVTSLQAIGYAVSLLGFFLYNYLKMTSNEKPPEGKGTYTAVPTKEQA